MAKLTRSGLRQLIKEELQLLKESWPSVPVGDSMSRGAPARLNDPPVESYDFGDVGCRRGAVQASALHALGERALDVRAKFHRHPRAE